MRLDPKYVEMERVTAVRGAEEWMENVVTVFARAAREVNNYKARFTESVEEVLAGKPGATKPEDVLSWTVNSINTPFSNLRLDMAVTHGARVTEAFRKVKELRDRTTADEVAERSVTARWMLTGHRTVLPSIKSARFVAEKGLRPEIVHLGTFEACYERAGKLGRNYNASKELVLNSAGRLPVVVTDDWTYHVVEIAAMDDAKV